MRTFLQAPLGLSLAINTAAATVFPRTNYDTTTNCKAVEFTVDGTATNRNLTSGLVLDTLDGLRAAFDAAPLITISGPQKLAGTFCAPTVKNANNGKLQTFFGSIVADRNGWSAQGGVGTDFPEYNPEKYSWVRFANAKGYPTLALDRLGTGKSSHPDPILVVQAPYEQALYANLATQLRSGAPQLPQAYKHLIYIGNSYGSQLGAGIAGQYPSAYDEFLLTGFSKNVQQDFLGVLLVLPAPAQIVDPARFGTLPLGYLTSSSQTGRTNAFFGSKVQVSFEDKVAELFFQRKDVVSPGQFISVYAGTFNGAGFKGRVLTLTGEQDQAFCGPGSPLLGPAGCGTLLEETGSLFPDAEYNWKSVDRTGHAIQLHDSAQTVFGVAHRWLAGETFKGGAPA